MNPRGVASALVLAAVAGFFGYVADLPLAAGVLVALGGVAAGVALQRGPRRPGIRAYAPVPVVGALVALAVVTPVGVLAELLAGAVGIAILLWLVDDPDRPPGGIRRAQLTLVVPAAALGIAWASALLLPPGAAPLGVAVGLLVFVIAAVAYLIGSPRAFDREGAPAS